jgi:multiple sugar transport system permease protein
VAQKQLTVPSSGWGAPPAKSRWRMTERRREAIAGYIFAGPWLIGLVCLTALPAAASIYFSFTDYPLLKSPQFIGLMNYVQLFSGDVRFLKALSNTLFIVALGVPIQMVVGLAMALLLNQKVRGLGVYRTLFFLPSQITGVALALLWGWILNPQFGVNSQGMGYIGIEAPLWLTDPNWVKPAFVMLGLWAIGTQMIIWLAGLQSIPEIYYEASEIDGAGRIRQLFSITLPLLTPTIFFTLITGIIGSFQIFTQALILTKGGPNDASLFYALYVYQQGFQFFQMGYACSLAWVLFVIIMVLTLLNLRFARTWVYYESVKE